MSITKVLIVDDDITIRKLLSKVMVCNGYQPTTAASGEEALNLLKAEHFHLILLDINMNGIDGFQTIQTIRQRGLTTPIIIISGRNEDYDTLYGLDIGADDYITKPFNPVILGAKAKALIRRNNASSTASKTIIQRGPFELDTAALKLYKDGEEIILSAKEFLVLKLFMENPGRVLTREVIYEAVWNDIIVDENTVMVYINHLRTKLEEDPKKPVYIKTVWGMGYTFSV